MTRTLRELCSLAVIPFGFTLLAGCDGGGGGGGGADGGTVDADEVIVDASPADGAAGVSADAVIAITFDRPAVPGTEDGGVFVGETEVDFEVSFSADNTVLTATPAAPWQEGTTYTVRLTALTFTDGTRLRSPYVFTFTAGGDGRECQSEAECDEGEECSEDGQCVAETPDGDGCTPMTCPFVTATETMAVRCTTPLPCATNVSTTDTMTIEFTQPFDLNDLGADLLSETGQSFDVTISQSNDQTQLIIALSEPLLENHSYAFVIEYVSDLEGSRTQLGEEFCFSTGDELNCPSAPECADHDATDGGVSAVADFGYGRPFGDESVFNTPIGDNPQIDPDSEAMMARFAEVFDAQGGIDISVRHDSVPVYIADESTRRVSVELTDVHATVGGIDDVPLPPEALPDCGFDTLLAAFDPETGTFYEFWRAVQNEDGTWRASTGNTIDAGAGSGIYPGDGQESEGVRASGFSLAAGLIWPHELESGLIEHALVFVFFPTRIGGPVAPAVASDGSVDDPAALPMGAHLQLDPDLDLDALDLEPWERTIAVALQTYGMYLGDTGSGIALSMLHAYSFGGNPYEGLLPEEAITEGDIFLTKLPPESFRVLSPPQGSNGRP